MRMAVSLAVLALVAAGARASPAAEAQLPPLPGEEQPEAPPLPGSAPKGANPLNAAHVDTLLTVEGIAAGGFGGGLAGERYLGNLVGAEAEIGYAGGRDATAGSVMNVLSLFAGPRLSLLATAVNGPSLGVAAGAALVWLGVGSQRFFYVWPQVMVDAGMKFSFGPGAHGFFLEPRVGYKIAFPGPEAMGQALPRYGRGVVGGLRLGLSF